MNDGFEQTPRAAEHRRLAKCGFELALLLLALWAWPEAIRAQVAPQGPLFKEAQRLRFQLQLLDQAAAEADSRKNPVPMLAPAGDLLQFLDGSSLHGALQMISTNQGVGWKHPDVRDLIPFKPDNLAWIRFENPKSVPAQAKPTCRFRFNNGDELFGKLASLDHANVGFETWFGGTLQAPRQAVQSITFLSKGYSVLYEGPTSADGWVQGRNPRGWEYRDGAFVANGAGTLGRDLHLTGSCTISFDLSWNGQFSLIVALYTPVLDRFDYSSSSYMFYLSPGYITLQRVQGGAGAINLGQAQIPDMSRKNKLHVEIRANKPDSTLGLFVDDRLVQRWRDTSGFVGQGSGLVFFAQLDGPSIRISNMKAAQWEGDFGLEASTNAPGKDDLVYLVNRDKVSGSLEKLHDDQLTVAASQTRLDIPLARVSQICLGNPTTNELPVSPWEMRAYFAGGGSVGFELEHWQKDRVTGRSQNFGKVEFDPQFIRQLQFNLNRTKHGAEDAELADQDAWGLETESSSTNALLARQALLFSNGDMLYGGLESASPTAGVRWRHPDAQQVIDFKPDELAEIQFPPRPRVPRTNEVNLCRLQLRNGDELEGSLVSFDPDQALLQTWYAGPVTVARSAVQFIVPIPAEGATVFEGPKGLDGWTMGKVVSPLGDGGQWRYHEGAFYATNAASIARDVKLPDSAKVEFDLTWKGLFQLAVALYTDYFQPISLANKDTEPDFGGFYSLQLNSFSANLLPVKKNDPLRYLGQVSVPAFNQKNTAHVEIRASKAKRVVALLVDGQLVKQWVDTEEFVGQGTGMRFVHQGQGKVMLSHFRVAEWDGQFEEKPVAAEFKDSQDTAKLRNGDKVKGQVESIRDGKVAVSTGSTRLEIPISRVKLLVLAGKNPDEPPANSGDVRATFTEGGAVTFNLETWEQGKLVGRSPSFGKLAFDPAAFSRVEFDLKSSPNASTNSDASGDTK